MRRAEVYFSKHLAGILSETDEGYTFEYSPDYLALDSAEPISITMPLRQEPYHERILFPFFDGLIPEGWLLGIAVTNWKIDNRDRFSLLLACCKDCIGAVSIVPITEEESHE